MPDAGQNLGETEGVFSKLEGTPFTVFSKPYLDFIEKGGLFVIFYTVMAIISLLIPFVVLYAVIRSGFLSFGGAGIVFAFIFSWIVIAFACWIGFQLWWDRKSKLKSLENSEFIVTLIFSGILQTFGEWLGTLIGIIGAGVGLITAIMLGNEARGLIRYLLPGIRFMPPGIAAIVSGPLTGFFIMIFTRFIAEQLRLKAALVSNTKTIAASIKESRFVADQSRVLTALANNTKIIAAGISGSHAPPKPDTGRPQ